MLISLLLPTRGRPALVNRLFSSIAETTSRLDQVEVILYVDEDDTGSRNLDCTDFRVVRIVGPALTMGGYNSACLQRARGDVLILANDDMVIRTPGWDDRIRAMHAEFEDHIYLGYANDLFKKSRPHTGEASSMFISSIFSSVSSTPDLIASAITTIWFSNIFTIEPVKRSTMKPMAMHEAGDSPMPRLSLP